MRSSYIIHVFDFHFENFNVCEHYLPLREHVFTIHVYCTFYGSKTKMCDIFLIFAQNQYFGCSLEPPQGGGFNGHPKSMFSAKTAN